VTTYNGVIPILLQHTVIMWNDACIPTLLFSLQQYL
jgi:hypothetical protein